MIRSLVQIPLWSIVTLYEEFQVGPGKSSNSSMVDSNMSPEYKKNINTSVQIPLWSIVTRERVTQEITGKGFKFLYGR